jgi:PhnB protein
MAVGADRPSDAKSRRTTVVVALRAIKFFDGRVELSMGRSSSQNTVPEVSGFAPNTTQETTMPQPIPYLAFDGNCSDAMRFYAKVLDGKLDMLTFGQSPMAEQTPKDALNRIMHARLALEGNGSLYAGDCPPGMPYQGIHGVSITLNFDAVGAAERVFNALADGGKVTMAFGPTFWAKRFGMVTDKFGCPWIVNGEMIDVQMQR